MSDLTPEESRAAKGYALINLTRIGGLAAVIAGIATAQGAIDLPYALGVALAIAGMLAFFFAPPFIARRYKSPGDNAGPEDER